MKKKNEEKTGNIGLFKDSSVQQNEKNLETSPYHVAKIYKNKVVIHKEYKKITRSNTLNKNCLKNLDKNDTNGYISANTASKLKKILQAWSESVRIYNESLSQITLKSLKKLTFLTLTLSSPQIHTDNEVKRNMLNEMIINLKRHFNITYYFWRAEPQQNGRIHFHIVADSYMEYYRVREMWNYIQEKNGYLKEFEKKYNHKNPNSTDVRIVNSDENFANYLIDYITKKNDRRKIEGRIWGMSDKLRDIDVFSTAINYKMTDVLNELIDKKEVEVINSEHFTMLIFKYDSGYRKIEHALGDELKNYYIELYEYLYCGQKHPFRVEVSDEINRYDVFLNGFESYREVGYTHPKNNDGEQLLLF